MSALTVPGRRGPWIAPESARPARADGIRGGRARNRSRRGCAGRQALCIELGTAGGSGSSSSLASVCAVRVRLAESVALVPIICTGSESSFRDGSGPHGASVREGGGRGRGNGNGGPQLGLQRELRSCARTFRKSWPPGPAFAFPRPTRGHCASVITQRPARRKGLPGVSAARGPAAEVRPRTLPLVPVKGWPLSLVLCAIVSGTICH